MATERNFHAEKYEEAFQELQTVREKLRSVSDRLGEAETALRFYGNTRNYEAARALEGKLVFQDRLKGDCAPADNDPNTNVAGRRAREYMRRYEIG